MRAGYGCATSFLSASARVRSTFPRRPGEPLRSERTRKWVADHNDSFFEQLGERLRTALDLPDADPRTLGFIAQSLYVGLVMHGAYADETDEALFEQAYAMLAALVN